MKYTLPAIIFDLDGTLWDATPAAGKIWNPVLEKHGGISFRMTTEISRKLMGKTTEEIGMAVFPNLSLEERSLLMEALDKEEVRFLKKNGAVLYDGLTDTLTALRKNHRLYIVSNCQVGYIEAFLSSHGLEDYFSDSESAGRTGLDKGSNIKLLMERNCLSSAVYVGDTSGDEKAAHAAGIPFIHASYGFGKSFAPDAVIQSIRELPECLRAFKPL